MGKNYFTNPEVARRYNEYRPNLHDRVVDRISDYCFKNTPIKQALDVACGTGHSSYPLRRIANNVIGIDASPEMLSQVREGENISFIQASAEKLPFPDHQFDLITVGLAFHWFETNEVSRRSETDFNT